MRKQKIWLFLVFFLPVISVCGDGVYRKSGKGFRDLNKNGKLDPYENPAESVEVRLQDLLRQMTLEEKVGQLAHTLGWNYYEKDENGQVRLTDLFRSDLKNRYIGCFWATLRADPWTRKTLRTGLSPREAAEMTNAMQRYARDSTRLGIPLFLAEECPHGHMAIGTTVFPAAIGRASTWNTELEERVAEIVALFTRGTYRLRACAGCCPGIALVSGGRGIRGRSFLEWEYGKCLCPGVTGRKRGEWRKCYSHVETLHGLRGA